MLNPRSERLRAQSVGALVIRAEALTTNEHLFTPTYLLNRI